MSVVVAIMRRMRSTALFFAFASLSCASGTEPRVDTFSAELFGTREIPPNMSAAAGVATIAFSDARLAYSVTASGFNLPPLFVQLQIGTREQVGAIVFRFEPVATAGVIASGTRDVSQPITYNTLTISPDSLRMLMRLGLTYVNVITAAYPGGEIRGQLVPLEQ